MTLLIKQTNGENLLTPEYLDILHGIWLESMNVTMVYEGEEWNYNDLCRKEFDSKNEPCSAVENSLFGIPFQIFCLSKMCWTVVFCAVRTGQHCVCFAFSFFSLVFFIVFFMPLL